MLEKQYVTSIDNCKTVTLNYLSLMTVLIEMYNKKNRLDCMSLKQIFRLILMPKRRSVSNNKLFFVISITRDVRDYTILCVLYGIYLECHNNSISLPIKSTNNYNVLLLIVIKTIIRIYLLLFSKQQ